MSPFDIINVINEKKPFDRSEIVTEYSPFIINRGFSMTMDTVFFANEMNGRAQLDKDQQFDFYLNAIPKGKRWGKWAKADKLEQSLTDIMGYFCINKSVAEQYLRLLSEEQLNEIHNLQNYGGKMR